MDEYNVVEDPKAVEKGAKKWPKASRGLQVDGKVGLLLSGMEDLAVEHLKELGEDPARETVAFLLRTLSARLQDKGYMIRIGMTWDAL